MPVFESLIVFALILLNGLLSLSELALISARRGRLKSLAEGGHRGAEAALVLVADPGRFLSTVQIGITLVGILAGAFSGATLGDRLARVLGDLGLSPAVAGPLGFGLVVAVITYLSLIIGELVPKQLALRNAEGVAAAVGPLMTTLSRIAAPAVWLLDASTRLVLRLTGARPEQDPTVTEEEIRSLIAEAETAGVIEPEERRMITGIMRLGDRPVRAVMTPRSEVDWIDLQDSPEEIRATVLGSSHERLPAGEGSVDALVGIVRARDVLAALATGEALDVRAMVRPAPIVPDTADAMDVLARLRESPTPTALIHDEYGNFEGVVTPADLMEAIAGAFYREEDAHEPDAVERDDGSWLLSGSMSADDMADRLGLRLPAQRDYHTVAGFVLAHMRRLPQIGESFNALGWRFEVLDLDRGRRIDKVLAQRAPARKRPRL